MAFDQIADKVLAAVVLALLFDRHVRAAVLLSVRAAACCGALDYAPVSIMAGSPAGQALAGVCA